MEAAHYRFILDSLSEGVLTVDRQWRITTFNRAAQEMMGVPGEEALGLDFNALFCCAPCECKAVLAEVMDAGEVRFNVATTITHRGGSRIPVNINVAPLRDDAGAIIGIVVTFRDVSAIELLRKELQGTHTLGDIASKNAAMGRIMAILPQVAEADSAVLITGPSGTGKELFARAIHDLSRRRDGPFVAVNCGALPDTLLESELFGYKEGAFTGAARDKPGRFALARSGTLFLDEIGDVSPALQVKLLRVLQEKEYEPLGATATEKADVRVIAATNRVLAEQVAAGAFRADLYYRLNVVEIALPALAERPEDIPLLADHFIRAFNAARGRTVKGLSRGALERLMRYPFPGNVRELKNAIEYAYILCPGDEIQEGCLPPSILESSAFSCFDAQRGPPSGIDEKSLIEQTLARFGGHRGRTAQALDIDKSTLWRKMKRYGIASARR